MIPSAAIACLLWLKAEHPTKVRAWWKILSKTWVVLCLTQIIILNGRQVVCVICQGVTTCNG